MIGCSISSNRLRPFELGVLQLIIIAEGFVERDEHVTINRGGDDHPSVQIGVGGEVRPTSPE